MRLLAAARLRGIKPSVDPLGPRRLFFGGLAIGVIAMSAVGLATAVTAISTLDGESHWFEGVQLLAVYAMIGVAAFFV